MKYVKSYTVYESERAEWNKANKLNEEQALEESVLAVAGGIALAVVGAKVVKKIAKKAMQKIGMNVEAKPEKLKEVVSGIHAEAIKKVKGGDKSKIEEWKGKLFKKIEDGEIKTLGGVDAYLDKNKLVFEEEESLEEGNKFSEARQKAIDAGEDEFEVDGKTYKVKGKEEKSNESNEELKGLGLDEEDIADVAAMALSERNAFLGARAKAIEEDAEEFEFNGKTYPVTSKKKEKVSKKKEINEDK